MLYDVRFDDGDFTEGLKREFIRTEEEYSAEFGDSNIQKATNVDEITRQSSTADDGSLLVDAKPARRKQEGSAASRFAKKPKKGKRVYETGTPCRAKWTNGSWYWGHVSCVRYMGDAVLYSVRILLGVLLHRTGISNLSLLCVQVHFDDQDTLDDIPQSYVLSDEDFSALQLTDFDFEPLKRKCGTCSMCKREDCGKCMTCTGNVGIAGKLKHVCLLKVRAVTTKNAGLVLSLESHNLSLDV